MVQTKQSVEKLRTRLTRKRRKTRYKTGIHVSPKCTSPIAYRSSLEKAVCCCLDENELVVKYSYEQLIIPYKSNIRTARIRRYFPDFLVEYVDGKKKLVEVKRENQLNNPYVKKKAEAAILWCKEHEDQNLTYEFWTEKLIRPLLKLYQAQLPQKPPKAKKAKKKKTKVSSK